MARRKAESEEKKIAVYFEIITPESAEEGEAADSGEAEEVEVDDVEEAIKMLKHDGATEPSSSHFHPGVWYNWVDPDIDYRTGESRYQSYHLIGFDEDEQREVFDAIVGGRRRSAHHTFSDTKGRCEAVRRGRASFRVCK